MCGRDIGRLSKARRGQRVKLTGPEDFVPREQVVQYMERYAASFDAPVHERVRVDCLEAGAKSRFLLRTSAGDLEAETVVVCSGAFQRAYRPAAVTLPPGMLAMDSGPNRDTWHWGARAGRRSSRACSRTTDRPSDTGWRPVHFAVTGSP
jgi:pyridine nucleotide-disulfide oxidoreductase